MADNRKVFFKRGYISDNILPTIRHVKGLEGGFGRKNSTTGEIKTQKPRLIKKQHNKCYYCKCKMVDTYEGQYRPANLATIEHLYTRRDIRRALYCQLVIACDSCNGGRNVVEQEMITKSFWCEIFDIRNLLTNTL